MFTLLSGKDEFSASEELARIRASGDFGYNQDSFTGETADLAVIRNTCDTMPFLAEKRLVVLEGLPRPRKGLADDADSAEDGDANAPEPPVMSVTKGKRGKRAATTGLSPLAFAKGLAEYITSLPATTMLVVLVPDELKADHPLMQAARRHGKSHVFAKPTGTQL